VQNHQEKRTHQSNLWESEAQTETGIITAWSSFDQVCEFLSGYYVRLNWSLSKISIFIIDLDRAYGRLLVDTMTKRFSKILVVERSDRVRLGESPNQLVTIGRTINRPKRTHTQRKLWAQKCCAKRKRLRRKMEET